jgi:hypothetical protein
LEALQGVSAEAELPFESRAWQWLVQIGAALRQVGRQVVGMPPERALEPEHRRDDVIATVTTFVTVVLLVWVAARRHLRK